MLRDAYVFDTDSIPPSAEVMEWALVQERPVEAPSSTVVPADWPLWTRLCVGIGGAVALLSGLFVLSVGLGQYWGLIS